MMTSLENGGVIHLPEGVDPRTVTLGDVRTNFQVTLPRDWRYNVKELRMEKEVPVYDDDEEYKCHAWVALVPDDIKEFIFERVAQLAKLTPPSPEGKTSQPKEIGGKDD